MNLPVDNVNICLLGCVSAGKSTILNALLCENLTQSKIKRTTMLPMAFVETQDKNTENNYKNISECIIKVNDKLIKDEELNSENLRKYSNISVYPINKLDLDISRKRNITIYDTPGLNDAKTKEIYYDYLEEIFCRFNIVVLIIDINSGTNTSDEIDMIDFVFEEINNNRTNNKHTKLIVVANKIDDMNLDTTTGELIFANDEYKEMYEQIETTINEKCEEYPEVQDNFIGIIPLCGLDAYLFRMIKSKNYNYKLTQSEIIRIGVSEHGNKFKMKKAEDQIKMVNNIIADIDFVDSMIKLSGFNVLNKAILECVNDGSNIFATENICYEINKIEEYDLYNFSKTYLEKIKLILKLKVINNDTYVNHMKETMTDVIEEFCTTFEECAEESFLFYNKYYDELILNNFNLYVDGNLSVLNMFEEIYGFDFSREYCTVELMTCCENNKSEYLVKLILNDVNHNLLEQSIVDFLKQLLKKFPKNKKLLDHILLEIIRQDTLLKNRMVKCYKTFSDEIMGIMDMIKKNTSKQVFNKFVKYVVMHILKIKSFDLQIASYLHYELTNEKIIKNWLNFVIVNNKSKISEKSFYSFDYETECLTTIEKFYLENWKEINNVNEMKSC